MLINAWEEWEWFFWNGRLEERDKELLLYLNEKYYMEIKFDKKKNIFSFLIDRWWIFRNQGENKYLQVCKIILRLLHLPKRKRL